MHMSMPAQAMHRGLDARASDVLYGLLVHERTNNLGDEIQSLAAAQFLPKIDRMVRREDLRSDPGGATKLLLNGWFMHRPERWPPNDKIQPLITSFHVSQHRSHRWQLLPAARILLAPWNVGYLRKHGPIGARDLATLALLQRYEVESYYSGCLTLTFPVRDEAAVGKRIVACDLDDELLGAVAKNTREPPIVTTHADTATVAAIDRLRQAMRLLRTYATAKAVITTRLHCVLPCLAMGTPVVFIASDDERQRYRQQPALELAQHCSRADFLTGRAKFDPENLPANPTAFRTLAAQLAEKCHAFFGTSAQLRPDAVSFAAAQRSGS
jgi:hypothetical protein